MLSIHWATTSFCVPFFRQRVRWHFKPSLRLYKIDWKKNECTEDPYSTAKTPWISLLLCVSVCSSFGSLASRHVTDSLGNYGIFILSIFLHFVDALTDALFICQHCRKAYHFGMRIRAPLWHELWCAKQKTNNTLDSFLFFLVLIRTVLISFFHFRTANYNLMVRWYRPADGSISIWSVFRQHHH